MEIKTIQFNSEAYGQMVNLRITQLLQPIGVPASYIEKEKEQHDIFIGAFENNEMIGCCVLTPKDAATIQLRQMVVHCNFRGNHVGAAIVAFAERIGRERNFSRMMLHARNPVISFYKKCGYDITGEPFFEVGMGHHKMQKQLF